jgi:hypothetical protein
MTSRQSLLNQFSRKPSTIKRMRRRSRNKTLALSGLRLLVGRESSTLRPMCTKSPMMWKRTLTRVQRKSNSTWAEEPRRSMRML